MSSLSRSNKADQRPKLRGGVSRMMRQKSLRWAHFSPIGLLRVHMLLDDSTLSLRVVENVAPNQPESERIL